MRTLWALLYKDIKLFLRSVGILALVLPLLMLPALRAFVSDSGAGLVPRFDIAVRDLDGTVMSRSLISQLRQVELFSEVRVLTDETDGEALNDGAAAVATIPKGLFYDLYDMTAAPVEVTLNADTPTQSALFEGIFTSVMSIVRANHAAALAVYRFAYPEGDEDAWREIRNNAGDRLALDALGRQEVFAADTASDAAGALTRRLAAGVLSLLAMFFALAAVKTVPEERSLGVLPRLRAAGGASWAFWVSKILAALALSAPAVVMTAILAGLGLISTLFLYLGLLLAAFSVMGFLASRTADPARVQRVGNLVMLASLALGGTLYPVRALPVAARALSRFTLPNLARTALDAKASGFALAETAGLLWPLYIIMALFFALSLLPTGARKSGKRFALSGGSVESGENTRKSGFFRRLMELSSFRLVQLAGGARGGAIILAAALLCAMAAGAHGGAAALKIAVCDRDNSAGARDLVSALAGVSGVEVSEMSESEGKRALLNGNYEGLLLIGHGFGDALADGGQLPLTYRAASAAGSERGAREIVAGLAVSQLRRVGCIQDARELLGRELDDAEAARLYSLFDAAAADMRGLYRVEWSDGRTAPEPFAPKPLAFGLLAALFTLLSCSGVLSARDARAASRRMRSLPGGRTLELLSALLSLWGIGFLVIFIVILPGGPGVLTVFAALLGALSFAALSLLLSRLTGPNRVDALAGLLALLMCLAGGCFADFGSLTPALSRLTLLSPAGLVTAAEGNAWAALAVLGEAAVFAGAALVFDRR